MTNQDFSPLWHRVQERLRSLLSADIYARWISVIRPMSLDGRRAVLGVANDFYILWLTENYLPLIRQALFDETGAPHDVVFSVTSDASEPAPAAVPPPAAPLVRRRGAPRPEPALNPSFTFESFVVGPANSFSHAACLAVAQKPALAYNPLLIYGGSGLGKTHLMHAVGHSIHRASRTARVCYISAEAFLNEYIESVLNKSPTEFRKKYRGMDVLLLDDVHFLAGKTGIQEEFFHTFNALSDARKQIVLTCDRPVTEIQGLDRRLVSRFGWGLVAELLPPDLETRMAILRKKAAVMNVTLPGEVMTFIAENIRTDIRKLEGALTRVVSYSSLCRQTMNAETVGRLLRDSIEHVARAPTTDAIQKIVAEAFDLRLSDMTSKRRPASVAFPRQIAMYLCRSLTDRSLPAIGDAFSRNHATVIHACRLVEDRMRREPSLRETVDQLRARLTEP